MKLRILTVAALAISLAACASLPHFGAAQQSVPDEVLKIQAETAALQAKALINRLDHCTITGTVDLNVSISTQAHVANTAGLTCPAKPWDPLPEPPT